MIIKLQRNFETLIDDEDYDLIKDYHWYADYDPHTKGHYVKTKVTRPDGRRPALLLHRLIMHAVKGTQVDHINHNPLDNRKNNLRCCTAGQNRCNSKKQSNNTTGFKGVYVHKKKFRAEVWKNYERYYLGLFNTAQEASEAYERAAKELHGEFYYRATEVN